MRSFVDLRPLRENRTFRRLWLGTTASAFGGQFGAFAGLYYVWEQTRSAAMVGLIGLATGVPMIVLALVGSAFVDHVDRRRLALHGTYARIVAGVGMAVVAFTMTGGAGVAAMLSLVAVQSALGGLVHPARHTFVAALLSGDRLAAGLALNHLSFQLAMLSGPAAAGAVTAVAGVGWCFVIDVLTFGAALIGLAGLPRGVAPGADRAGAAAVLAGLRYAGRTAEVRGALLADLAATLLAMPIALFPVINAARYGDRPEILGLFTTALAVGGVIASALSGLATRHPRPGVILLVCGAIWAAALGGAGLATPLVAVLALLAVAGAADTWAVVARGTVVQTVTPDAYRGRIAALEQIAGSAGPHLGNVRAGLVAGALGGPAAMVIGGATALAATAALAVVTPALRRFQTPAPAPEPVTKA